MMEFQGSAERRFLTILHCDLVDSTKLVDRVDPEEILELMAQFLNAAQRVVEKYKGVLAGYTGDGFEAYFGYPVVTETPAADAISAALDVLVAVHNQNAQQSHKLECRLGVATGIVVVGTLKTMQLGRRQIAFGPVPHLAARLQSIAQPRQIFVDDDTRQLADMHFTFSSVGPQHLKGFEESVSTHRVLAAKPPVPKFNRPNTQLTPLVGRQYVLDVLNERWNVALDGGGQLVILYGEAGLGKSRALHEFEELIENQTFATYRFQCSSQHVSTPLHPWLHYLTEIVKFSPEDSNQTRLEKLKYLLHHELNLSPELQEFCLILLGFSERLDSAPVLAASNKMLVDLQKAFIDLIFQRAQKQPVLIIIEDEQWIDATSEIGLSELIDRCLMEPVLVCITARPGSQSITKYPYATSLSLTRLSGIDVRAMLLEISNHRAQILPESAIKFIVEKCDGNPLYVEEIATMAFEQPQRFDDEDAGSQSYISGYIPVTLQASLLARVDKIAKGKDIAQLASVFGGSFSEALISKTDVLASEHIYAGLNNLVELNILVCHEREKETIYEFRHALLREALYESLLNDMKKTLHAAVARCYASHSKKDVELRPELIARHYDLAGDWRSAVYLWIVAGERTLRSGATTEAVSLLDEALKFQSQMEKDATSANELHRLHLAYGIAINALGGAGADPYRHFHRAAEMGALMQDHSQTANALDWQFGVDFNAGRLDRSKKTAEELRLLGESFNHGIAFMAGSQALGMVNFMLGNFELAENIFLELFNKKADVVSELHCYPSMSLSYLAWTQFALEKYQEAEASAIKSIASARRESSHSVATALSNCSYVFQCLGDLKKVDECTHELIEHCGKYGENMYLIRGKFIKNWLELQSSDDESLLDDMQDQLKLLIDAHEEIELTYLYSLLAEVLIKLKRFDDAKDMICQALVMADANGEKFNMKKLQYLDEVANHG